MIPQLGYKDGVFGWTVDEPVLIVNAPGPIAGKPVFERFRLRFVRQ